MGSYKLALRRAGKWGQPSAERTGQNQCREADRWVGTFFGAPELFVWDASGFRGTQTKVFWVTRDRVSGTPGSCAACGSCIQGVPGPPTPWGQLLRCCLPCPVGQRCPGGAQPKGPGGAWLHPLIAAPLRVTFPWPSPLSLGNRPGKGCGRGLPRTVPPETLSQGTFTQGYFPAFPKERLGVMRVVSTQVLDNSTRRCLAAPPPSDQPSWDISKSLSQQELPRQLGGWRGTSRRDLCRVLCLDAGPHGDAFAEKEHPQRGFGDPLVPHTDHPPAGEGGPAGAQ